MSIVLQHPAAIPPMPAVARILSRFTRDTLEAFVSIAIDLMDVLDGDPDSDEDDAEDAFGFSVLAIDALFEGPGCPISDPGGGNVEDHGEPDDDAEPDLGDW